MSSSKKVGLLRRALPKLFLIVFGLSIGLIVVEIISRCIYRKPWHEELLEQQRPQRYDILVNSLGLRGPAYMNPKVPGTIRILVLGDSFTFGHGVTDDRAIFPTILERELNAESAGGGHAIEILNGGLWGSMTGQWLELFERVKDRFEPDIVVMVFFLRDGTRTSSMGGFFGPIRQQIVAANRRSAVYQFSYAYRLYKDLIDRNRIHNSYSRALLDSYIGTPEQTEEWRLAQENMHRIKLIAESRDATTALVIFPVLAELNEHYPFQPICRVIAEFGEKEDLPTHDLLPAFLHRNAPELWISPFDQHPNARAHSIAASSLLPFFRQLVQKKAGTPGGRSRR
jgi:hypothetical protein